MAHKSLEQERSEALAAFSKEVGPKAYVCFHLVGNSGDAESPYLAVYPNGITGRDRALSVRAPTFDECLKELRSKWNEVQSNYRAETIRKMAHAIIDLTHKTGGCTNHALRAEFGEEDIASLGKYASALANEMADNGPFAIIELEGANAA